MLVYHPALINYDQYLAIVQSTIQNVVIAAEAMQVVSLLLISKRLCSSICYCFHYCWCCWFHDVLGCQSWVHIHDQPCHLYRVFICIGLLAYVLYAFGSNGKPIVNERAVEALYILGYLVTQEAFSTLLGVVSLTAAETYIFRNLFKIMFLLLSCLGSSWSCFQSSGFNFLWEFWQMSPQIYKYKLINPK